MFWDSNGPFINDIYDKNAEIQNSWTLRKAEALTKLRKMTEFTDLIIVSEDGIEFPVHSEIVCAASDYFDCIIWRDAQASEDIVPKMSIHGIMGVTLQVVLDFLYSGVLTVSLDTVVDLFRAGDFLSMPVITEGCVDWFDNSFKDNLVCSKSGLLLYDLYQQYEYPQLVTTLKSLLYRKPFECADLFRRLGCDYLIDFFTTNFLRKADHIIMGSFKAKQISELLKLCFPDKSLDSLDGLFLESPRHLYITVQNYAAHPVPGPGILISENWHYTCAEFPPQDWTISQLNFSRYDYQGCIAAIDVEYRNVWSGERKLYTCSERNGVSSDDSFSLDEGETICAMELFSGWVLNGLKVTTSLGRTSHLFGSFGGGTRPISMSIPTLAFEIPSDASLPIEANSLGAGSNPCLALHGFAYQEIVTSNCDHIFNIHLIFSGLSPEHTSSNFVGCSLII